jgi:cytochrome o ubiquinol oxidase subunit I
VPTGVKVFNWIFTLYGGRVHFASPLLWSLGFICTFVIGGMTGVLLAIPPADFVLHNSLFLVAHFHNVIIGGVLFGAFAGYAYWFPKAFGFQLHEGLGKASFWCWLIGFYLAFMPLYALGLMGATRRMQHYDNVEWQPLMLVAMLGALVILTGIVLVIVQLVVSIRDRAALADRTGDPWQGRTLEWSTASPPADYNFAFTPVVHSLDAWQDMKAHGYVRPEAGFLPIHMPRNTGAGVILAGLSAAAGFGFIWQMWWLAAGGLVAIVAVAIGHSFNKNRDFHIPVEDVVRTEAARTELLRKAA